jgi:hypothetical protein
MHRVLPLLILAMIAACDTTVLGGGGEESGPDAGTAGDSPDAQPAGDTDASPAPSKPLEVTNMVVSTGKDYELVALGAEVGQKRYIDRNYKFTQIPASLAGLAFLKTSNSDADTKGERHITFNVNQGVRIYIAHDDRKQEKPAWLAVYTDTGEELQDSDDSSRGFSIFSAALPAGEVILGGNRVTGDDRSMYSVFIEPIGP